MSERGYKLLVALLLLCNVCTLVYIGYQNNNSQVVDQEKTMCYLPSVNYKF